MQNFLFVRNGGKYSKILFSDIQYVEAVKKYVRIITQSKRILIQSSITYVEKILPAEMFCRIHRSYIISLQFLTDFEHESAFISNIQLPISRSYRELLPRKVIILRSEEADGLRLSDNDVDKLIGDL